MTRKGYQNHTLKRMLVKCLVFKKERTNFGVDKPMLRRFEVSFLALADLL